MKFDRRDPECYLAHSRFVAALMRARCDPLRDFERQARIVPAVALYGHSLSGNLKAFFDYALTRSELPYDVFYGTLDRGEYALLSPRYGDRVELLASRRGVSRLLACSCVMTSHGPGALRLLHFVARHIHFVDVWHGLNFKGYTAKDFGARMHAYDGVFVSSEGHRHVYCTQYGFSPAQVAVTGYARVDGFRQAATTATRVRQELGLPEEERIVVYAPTWRTGEDSGEVPFGLAAAEFLEAMELVCERLGVRMILRLHMNSSLAFDTSRYHHLLQVSQQRYPETNDLLCATDVLITDWSSVACDFYALGRPVVFLDTPVPTSFESGVTEIARVGEHAVSLDQLVMALERALAVRTDALQGELAQVIEYCYGTTLDGKSAQRYDAEIRSLLRCSRLSHVDRALEGSPAKEAPGCVG